MHRGRDLKANDPLAPVMVVAPNYLRGAAIVVYLARAGGSVNVRTMLMGDFATQR